MNSVYCQCGKCEDVRVVIEDGKAYEKHGFLKKIYFYFFWLPFINLLPKNLCKWIFVSSNDHTKAIRETSKTYKSLELMYQYYKQPIVGAKEKLLSSFWESSVINAGALRNRLVLTKKELRNAIQERMNGSSRKIRILSVASGSARAVIEAIAELKLVGSAIEVRLVDISRSALDYSKGLASEFGVSSSVELIRADVRDVSKYCNGWKPDIIEMVGLLDYFHQPEAIQLVSALYDSLAASGALITCNVNDNPEREFVTDVVNWAMVYRSRCQMAEVLLEGGFHPKDCTIFYEPFLIHGLAVANKNT